jgi:hypothetical protein
MDKNISDLVKLAVPPTLNSYELTLARKLGQLSGYNQSSDIREDLAIREYSCMSPKSGLGPAESKYRRIKACYEWEGGNSSMCGRSPSVKYAL